MDPQVQASFIPKKPLVSTSVRQHSHTGLLWFLTLLFFIASLIAAGAAFGYQQYLQKAIQSESASLARAQAAYDPTVIADLIRLNNRLIQGKLLLSSHVAPSSIFTLLEGVTLSNVRFTSFQYTLSPNGNAVLSLSGEALDFSSVALQSDAFGQQRVLKDILFSDINVDPGTGHITFKVSSTIDPSFLLYEATPVVQNNAVPVQVTPTAPVSTTTSAAPTTPAASKQGTTQAAPPAGASPFGSQSQ